MCLGGGSATPTYKPPTPTLAEPGPASPNDMINNQTVDNINDRSKQQNYRQANRGGRTTSQSSKNTGLY